MNKWLRIIVKTIGALVVLVAIAVAVLYVLTERRIRRTYAVSPPALTIPSDAASIERGRRIAHVVSVCGDCHGEDLGGKVMTDTLPMGRLAASNLTRGKGGIGGRYGDADWVRTLVHGVRPDGRAAIFMPSHEIRFTEPDLAALIAYLKSLPAVDRELPEPRIGPAARLASYFGMPLLPAELIDHENVRLAKPANTADAVAIGRELAEAGGCHGCHLPDLSGGGGPPPGAANLTPAALGSWTEADFFKAMRTGRRPDGSAIAESMPRTFGQMSDEELQALWKYLQSVPPRAKKS